MSDLGPTPQEPTPQEPAPAPVHHERRRHAVQERHRLQIVWLVPIIALFAAGWLGYHALAERGPLITITLQSAEGLEVGKTKVKHRDIELGTVEGLEPSKDLSTVTVLARMNRHAESHLSTGTRFWVVRPRLSAEGISGLGTLISGSYIEMEPGPGEPETVFTGLEDPPVVTADVPGTRYELHGRRLGSISQGAPVSFRGVKVGEVLGYQLVDEDGTTTVQVFVRAPHDKLVHRGTRFWNASGFAVELTGDGLKLQTESLQAILAGGVAFDVPIGGEAGPPAQPASVFTLYADEDAARDALFSRRIPFLLHLAGSAQGLTAGAAVRMRGIKIGEVTDVHIEYDEAADQVSVPVTMDIEPDRVKILNPDLSQSDFKERSYAAFRGFVARGLRARLQSGNLLTGQKVISLDFMTDQPKATLIEGGVYPEIPTVQSDDLDSIMQSAKTLLASLQSTVASLHAIVASPEVKRSLASLDRALANIDHLTADASVQIGPLLSGLHGVLDSADDTLKKASSVLSNAVGDEGEHSGDLAGTLRELKEAARSLHVLTDYLDNHPESLIQGKSGSKR
jgi:paraquat-inducible protein B